MSEKLLITGGSGFVAYHTICEALKQGYEVFVAVRSSSSVKHLEKMDVKFVTLDYTDIAALQKELESNQYDFVIHTAGTTSAASQEEYNTINATFSYNLAKAAANASIPLKKFVFVSSLAATGPSDLSGIILEENEKAPVTAYGRSKMLAEQLIEPVAGLPLITFRPTAVYGPREKDIFIILKTIAGGFEPYIGKKPQQLSFVYVKDLAVLLVNALKSPVNHKAYNVADGNVYDRFALAGITKSITGNKTVRLHLPTGFVKGIASMLEKMSFITKKTPALNRDKINELTASWVCSIEAVKRDLNFSPLYDLQAGLKETLQWYKTNNWL